MVGPPGPAAITPPGAARPGERQRDARRRPTLLLGNTGGRLPPNALPERLYAPLPRPAAGGTDPAAGQSPAAAGVAWAAPGASLLRLAGRIAPQPERHLTV